MRVVAAHYSPRYVWDRVRLGAERRLRPFTPMLAGEITRRLAAHIKPDHHGLEAGSGVSTIWFAERSAHLVSIEHDPGWAARVRNWLAERGLSHRVDLRLCEPTPSGTARAYVGIIVRRCIPSDVPSRTPYARAAADGIASPRWTRFAELVHEWPCLRATNGVYETAMWTKPA